MLKSLFSCPDTYLNLLNDFFTSCFFCIFINVTYTGIKTTIFYI
jgi:hypothetical protein